MDEPQPSTSSGLAALGTVTAETDAGNPDPAALQQKQDEQKKKDEITAEAREWGQFMFVIGGTVTMLAPELQRLYTQEACLNWGTHAAAVAAKYKWKSPALPELALAAATLHLALPTFLVLRSKVQQVKDAQDAGPLAKVVMWWRERRARKAAEKKAPVDAEPGQGDGGQ